MLTQLEKPCAVLSVRVTFATYAELYRRSQERGTKISVEARDLLTQAIQGGEQAQQEGEGQTHD